MPEAYEAIQKKVIDGSMTPMETLRAYRLAEVTKYVTECWQIGQVYTFFLIMNKNTWGRLPQDIKRVFTEYPFEEKLARMWNEVDIDGKKLGMRKGLEFIQLEPHEADRWVRAANTVVEKFTKSLSGAGYKESDIHTWIAFVKDRIRYWLLKQQEMNIKSSTGPEQVCINEKRRLSRLCVYHNWYPDCIGGEIWF